MRIGYQDEQSRRGEMEMSRVVTGDLVRFIADFRKTGDDGGSHEVDADEIGEVIACGPEQLRIAVPGRRHAEGVMTMDRVEIDAGPREVVLLVDGRDPRVSSQRLAWSTLEAALTRAAVFVDVQDQSLVAAELWRHSRSTSARTAERIASLDVARVALETEPSLWRELVAGLGLVAKTDEEIEALLSHEEPGAREHKEKREKEERSSKAFAAYDDNKKVIDWALAAFAENFEIAEGRPPELSSREDVMWVLDALARDLYTDPDPYDRVTENVLASAERVRGVADELDAVSDEEWTDGIQRHEAWAAEFVEEVKKLKDTGGRDTGTGTGTGESKVKDEPFLPGEGPGTGSDIEEAEAQGVEQGSDLPLGALEGAPVEPAPAPAPEPAHEGLTLIPWRSPRGNQWVHAEPGLRIWSKARHSKGVIESVQGRSLGLKFKDGSTMLEPAETVLLHAEDDWGLQFATADEVRAWKGQKTKVRHTACYATEHGDTARGADAPDNTYRTGAEAPAGPPRGNGGRDPGRGPGRRQGLAARELWDGVVFHLDDATGDGPSDTAGRTRVVALAPLGVKEMKRWMSMDGEFAVISAYQSKGRSKSVNQAGHGKLVAELQRRGYGPSQIRGLRGQYFGETGEKMAEQSVLIFDMPFREALEVGTMFGQESVIYKSPEGTIGAYYTDGTGRANVALVDGQPALGEAAADVRVREPKPEHMGPPSERDPWSKARGVGFEFPIDWGKTFSYGDTPLSAADIEEQLRVVPPRGARVIVTTAELSYA